MREQPKDYYTGPNVHDEDFVVSNYVDLRAIREEQRRVDAIDSIVATIVLVGLGMTMWWVLR